jgi:2-dehydro-3-deoxygluconokinase
VSLGALVHRLDPGMIPFRKATQCDIHVSGGEFNVAANLADCFGLRTGIATAMVDYPIGDLIAERVRAMGVTPLLQALRAQRRDRPQHGHGLQRPRPWRAGAGGVLQSLNEAAAQLKPGDFDWEDLCGGVRWFHSGGIFAALSETTGE